MEFARFAAGRLAEYLLRPRTMRLRYPSGSFRFDGLLDQVAALVRDYLGSRYDQPDLEALRYFDSEIDDVRNVLDRGRNGVLVLKGAGNAFDLDIVVDVANPRARRGIAGLSHRHFEYDDESEAEPPPPPPPLTSDWLRSIDLDTAPVRRVDREEAARSFVTLFADAFRMLVGTGGGSGTGSPVYEANANRRKWFLECWPQFNYSPKRFGNSTTWPVHDTLPVSGDYMFQGLKGSQISKDPSPHYFGPTRTSTTVNL